LSREEREAAYNKARERIFGNSEKAGDATPDTEEGNDMSRSSSMSTKDKSGQSKRGKAGKQRRDDSENFDVRSQYAPFFPPQQQPTWTPMSQYGPMGNPQFPATMPNTYPVAPSPHYTQPAQHFHSPIMASSAMPPYMQMSQQYHKPSRPQFQPHNTQMATYGSPVPSPPQQPQPWSQTGYQNPYHSRGPMQGASTIPYPYGQLPSTANPADPKSQHPIPGSFNRHAFNPKTQSFVPGNGIPVQQTMSHNGSPHLPFNTFSTPPQYSNGMGYNMSRQGSNTSVPSYHVSPHMPPRPMIHQGMNPAGSTGSHLPHFGNVSSLPPKPPPAA